MKMKMKCVGAWVTPFVMISALLSLGNILLPNPVKLDTYFGNEICLLKDESAEEFAYRVQKELHRLIDVVNNKKDRPHPIKNQPLINIIIIMCYTTLQNILIIIFVLILIIIAVPISILLSYR